MEEMSPPRIVKYLNCFHDAVSTAVIEWGGIVTNIQGDSATAVFGVPYTTSHDSSNAANAAISLKGYMETTNEILQGISLPAMSIGIGIATGTATCGAIGSKHNLQYQVFGGHF
jgi:adenylate cyclase